MTEEDGRSSTGWAWAVIVALCACLLAWGLLNYVLIRDEPRRFDLNALSDVPGQSVYSTEPAPKGRLVPPQVEPLPEAVPRRPARDAQPTGAPPAERRNP